MGDAAADDSPVGLEAVTRLFWTPYTGTEAERAAGNNNNSINNTLVISRWHFKDKKEAHRSRPQTDYCAARWSRVPGCSSLLLRELQTLTADIGFEEPSRTHA